MIRQRRLKPRPHRNRRVASSPSDDIFRRLQQAFLEKNELYHNKDALKRSVDHYPPVLLKEYREDKDKYILFAMLKHGVNVVEYIKNGKVDPKRVMELRSGDNETIFDYAINDFNKDIFNLVFEVDCRQVCMDALMHRSDDHDSVLETMIDELKDFDYEYLFGNDNTSVSENVDAMKDFLLKEDSYVIRTLHEQNDDLLSTIQESLKKTMVHAVDSQHSIRSDARDYIEVDDDASENEIENKIYDLTHDHDGHSHAWDVENACKDLINAIDEVRSKTTELVEKYKQEFPRGTPLVVACEMGRLDDVKVLAVSFKIGDRVRYVDEHPDGRSYNNNGTVTEVYSMDQVHVKYDDGTEQDEDDALYSLQPDDGFVFDKTGKNSKGMDITPLMAASWYERVDVVEYLLQVTKADANVVDVRSENALHYAACWNQKSVKVVKMLMDHMTLDSINKKDEWAFTPLDYAHKNNSPNRQQIIDLMRSKGAKRASELSGSSTVEDDVVHEGTKTVDEQLAEQLKKAEEKGDVIDLTDAHESVNDQLHKHITPSDQTELNETLEKIKKLEKERKKINNELKKLRRRASHANGYSTNKRQRIKLLDAIGELKF